MSKFFENGLISSSESGDSFISNDLIITGNVFWVDSVNGSDVDPGTDEKPFATLAKGITDATASNGGVIVLKASHAETLSGAITVSKAGLKIFGLGTGSTKPSFTVDAAIDGIDITAASVELNNLRFPIGTTATNTSRVNIAADDCQVVNCDFLCGAEDLESITLAGSISGTIVQGCTFTVSADGPDAAIEVEAAGNRGLEIISCTFDAGGAALGWAAGAVNSAVAHLNFEYVGNTLTNGSDIIHSAAAKGYISGTIASDSSHIEISSGSSRIFENGIVSSSQNGDSFITNEIIITGDVYWVDSVNGSDANAGNEDFPFATLSVALSAISTDSGDLIILNASHSETIAPLANASEGYKIFGLGTSSTKPSFSLLSTGALLTFSGKEVELNNLQFPVSTVSATSRIAPNGRGAKIKSCDFSCGALDLGSIVTAGVASGTLIDNCTFTVSADGPDTGINIGSGSITYYKVNNCTFNGGGFGWDDGAIFTSTTPISFEYDTVTLTNRSDIIHTSAAKGWISNHIAGDGSHISI